MKILPPVTIRRSPTQARPMRFTKIQFAVERIKMSSGLAARRATKLDDSPRGIVGKTEPIRETRTNFRLVTCNMTTPKYPLAFLWLINLIALRAIRYRIIWFSTCLQAG